VPVADARPLLRGWFHAAMVPLGAAGFWQLWRTATDLGAPRGAVAVFGVCLIGLYGISSLYHVPRWGRRMRLVLSRCDGAMIQLFIAGTFTPVAIHALSGAWRVWSLVVAWSVAVLGATVAASPIKAPRWLGTLGYIAVGWLGAVPLFKVLRALPWEGAGLFVLGGVLYTVGAIIYAGRRPDPAPSWFGYHEIFHLFVITGSIAHYMAIWAYLLPAARG
jgi:hemolysin III